MVRAVEEASFDGPVSSVTIESDPEALQPEYRLEGERFGMHPVATVSGPGLAIAVTLGYLEDLHQGAPIGVLCMAHALGWLAIYAAARRFTLVGPGSKIMAASLMALGIDTLTWALLRVSPHFRHFSSPVFSCK